MRAAYVHPGSIQTELSRHMTAETTEKLLANINANEEAPSQSYETPTRRYKTIQQGAATSIWAGAVAAADEVGGRYCEDCHVAEVIDIKVIGGVRPYAIDPARARALRSKSEEMVGERFP